MLDLALLWYLIFVLQPVHSKLKWYNGWVKCAERVARCGHILEINCHLSVCMCVCVWCFIYACVNMQTIVHRFVEFIPNNIFLAWYDSDCIHTIFVHLRIVDLFNICKWNQCLSLLKLRVQLESTALVFSGYTCFLHRYTWPPWYNWNIVESGVKHHNPNHLFFCLKWNVIYFRLHKSLWLLWENEREVLARLGPMYHKRRNTGGY